jgi:hypothetical protein
LWAKVEAKVEVKGGIKTPMFPPGKTQTKHRQSGGKTPPGKNTDKTQTKWGKNTPPGKTG